MSVPTAEPTTPTPGVRSGAAARSLPRGIAGGRLYALLAGASLAIAALSLLIPSTPSYDPWSWIIWGREITHWNLHTPGGPTWKPLPVLFTTVFSLFGQAAPFLWLMIARAGALLAVLMVFALAARLTWWLRSTAADRLSGGVSGAAAYAPAVLAGLIAAVALALSGGFLASSTLGYSEGLMVAAVLIAIERHLDGHRQQAFAVAFIAALDRPEIWLFWGPYGLWLMWREPSSRKLVIGLAVLTLAVWFVPQKLGGGSWFSGVSRAQHPRKNSAAFASCPFCSELVHHAWPQVLLRLKLVGALAVGFAVFLLGRAWRGRMDGVGVRVGGVRLEALRPVGDRERALLTMSLIGLFGLGWWILVALETQGGFSGNDRYLVLGSAMIEIAGGVGFGWLAIALERALRSALSRDLRAPITGASRVGAATLLSGVMFLVAPNWVGANLIDVSRTHRSIVYQAHLRQDLQRIIAGVGGPTRMLACGSVMVEGFQVPMVAWYLGVHMVRVLDQPNVNSAGVAVGVPAPSVILQDRDNRSAALLPLWSTIHAWEQAGTHYRVQDVRTFRFFEDCRK